MTRSACTRSGACTATVLLLCSFAVTAYAQLSGADISTSRGHSTQAASSRWTAHRSTTGARRALLGKHFRAALNKPTIASASAAAASPVGFVLLDKEYGPGLETTGFNRTGADVSQGATVTVEMVDSNGKPIIVRVAATTAQAATAKARPFIFDESTSLHDWPRALDGAWRFYEAQTSGVHPLWSRLHINNGGWRSDAHTNDGRGPDGVNTDLSGGWYDAGDHLKITLPMAYSATMLAMGVYFQEAGYRATGQLDIALRNLRNVAEYFVKCHLVASDVGSQNVLVAQVGDTNLDHGSYWGRPEQQAENGVKGQPGWRPVFTINNIRRGSEVASSVSSALAATSVLLRRPGPNQDAAFADAILLRARQLYKFAVACEGTWNAGAVTRVTYPVGIDKSHVFMASAWLCLVDGGLSGIASCQDAASRWQLSYNDASKLLGFDWSQVFGAANLLMLHMNIAASSKAQAALTSWNEQMLAAWENAPQCKGTSAEPVTPCATPDGFGWAGTWGSARQNGNAQFIAMTYTRIMASRGMGSPDDRRTHRCYARGQLAYLLGSNSMKQSFVVGYTAEPSASSPLRAHHRGASCNFNRAISCSWNDYGKGSANGCQITGGLVGGPAPNDAWTDDRQDYVKNEVANDYNAAFTGALAGMADLQARLPGCSLDDYCNGYCEENTDPVLIPQQRSSPPQPAQIALQPALQYPDRPNTPPPPPPPAKSPPPPPPRSPSPPPPPTPSPSPSPLRASPPPPPPSSPSPSPPPPPFPAASPSPLPPPPEPSTQSPSPDFSGGLIGGGGFSGGGGGKKLKSPPPSPAKNSGSASPPPPSPGHSLPRPPTGVAKAPPPLRPFPPPPPSANICPVAYQPYCDYCTKSVASDGADTYALQSDCSSCITSAGKSADPSTVAQCMRCTPMLLGAMAAGACNECVNPKNVGNAGQASDCVDCASAVYTNNGDGSACVACAANIAISRNVPRKDCYACAIGGGSAADCVACGGIAAAVKRRACYACVAGGRSGSSCFSSAMASTLKAAAAKLKA